MAEDAIRTLSRDERKRPDEGKIQSTKTQALARIDEDTHEGTKMNKDKPS